MTNEPTVKTLTPSFGRAFVRVLWQLLLCFALAALSDRYRCGHWWTAGYCASLILPLLLYPVIVYFGFVPRRIQWSRTECRIQSRLDGTQRLPWTQLAAYGDGNQVFYLKFKEVRRFQIFAGAFPRGEWQEFLAFLKHNYPVKKSPWFVRAIWGNRVA